MGYLLGLDEYLDESYNISIFDQASSSKQLWELHLHNNRVVKAIIYEDLKYDLNIKIERKGNEVLPKTDIKLIYPAENAERIKSLLKEDKKVKSLGLQPIPAPKDRYHVKNKTLFPLMKERNVVFFTLLEGEIIKGLVAGFCRYEITVSMKGRIPITILRHSIYDLYDKKGRNLLKSSQEKFKDWQKSELFLRDTGEKSSKKNDNQVSSLKS